MESFIYTKEQSINSELCTQIIDYYEKTYINSKNNKNNNIHMTFGNDKNFIKIENKLTDILKVEINNYIQLFKLFFTDYKYNKDIYTKKYLIKKINKNTNTKYNTFLPSKNNNFITFIFYLNTININDDNKGTDIFFDNTHINPTQGKLVLFPSDWIFPHKHDSSLTEDKYILKGEIVLQC